jgi:hypothetical protein
VARLGNVAENAAEVGHGSSQENPKRVPEKALRAARAPLGTHHSREGWLPWPFSSRALASPMAGTAMAGPTRRPVARPGTGTPRGFA